MKTYCHAPWVPEALEPILDVAYNFAWANDPESRAMFEGLNPGLWRMVGANPVLLLRRLTRGELERRAADSETVGRVHRAAERLKRSIAARGGRALPVRHGEASLDIDHEPVAAYFSAEFGMHESLPVYSGGLGILAGDHLRSASDLGLPFVGIGLLYRFGYFHQRFSLDDWQLEEFEPGGFFNMPLRLVTHDDGSPLSILLDLPDRELRARVWRADVGRNPLFLLDSYIRENQPADREVTARLYDSDRKIRLEQELLLGIGGVKLLEALDITPRRFHMNEGHSAFLVLQRAAKLIEADDISFDEARLAMRPSNVFTTHTPVPAGHEVFDRELLEPLISPRLDRLRLSADEFFALGRREGAADDGRFEMTALAVRFSEHINGVSRRHGEVAREQNRAFFGDVAVSDVPIGHVTNGIHAGFWVGEEMREVFDRHLGAGWPDHVAADARWSSFENASLSELWQARCRQRARLVEFIQVRAQDQLITRNADRETIRRKVTGLDPRVLTLGFARRFATYKRATLLLSDPDRLARILTSPERPVQIVIAGKAHPADDAGKGLLQQVIGATLEERFHGRLVVLEDYDISVGRELVQGCDVWVNTPRPPQEASGTSGMKSCANGGLTLSTYDGWWIEAASPEIGWTIGDGDDGRPADEIDAADAKQLLDFIEFEIVPEFYDRAEDGEPKRWLEKVRRSVRQTVPFFNTSRMVRDYAENYYLS